MDKVLKYQNALKTFLKEYTKGDTAVFNNIQNQVIIDDQNNHYQLVRVGWQGNKHIHYAVFHFDIIEEKVWVQQNRTDLPIGYELQDLGIAENDLIYAYLPASLRSRA